MNDRRLDGSTGTDEEIIASICFLARLIAAEQEAPDIAAWCVRVANMRNMLQELTGQPIDHGDFLNYVREKEKGTSR